MAELYDCFQHVFLRDAETYKRPFARYRRAARFERPETDIDRWVAYYRVSTAKQGASGLGLEAQTASVASFISAQGGEIIASFTETESGKKASNRPELLKALGSVQEEAGDTGNREARPTRPQCSLHQRPA